MSSPIGFLNRKVSTSVGIMIILTVAVVGGLLTGYQCFQIFKDLAAITEFTEVNIPGRHIQGPVDPAE